MDRLFWFALLIAFVVAEAVTVNMVSAWFAAGSLAALIAALLGAKLWLQIVLFLVVSTVALALLRPVAKKYFTPRLTPPNVDALVGTVCMCVTAVDNMAGVGQVKIGDVEWSARSTTGEEIPVGSQVKIDRVEGVKVYVTPVAVAVK